MSLLSGVKSVQGEEDILRLGSDAGEGMDIDLGGQELDLGLDLGGGFGDLGDAMDVDMNDEDRERARRESTRLSTPPPLDEQDPSSLSRDLDSETAARIAELAAQQEQRAERAKPKKRVRIAAIDEEIELEDGVGRRDVTAILGEENYLPANKDMIALLQIRQDPVAFYSPTVKKDNQDYYLAGPVSGMAEELAELFMIPVRSGLRRGPIAPAERQEEEEDDVELGRRDERRASERFGQGAQDTTLDDDLGGFGGFGDETGLELEQVEGMDDMALGGDLARKRDASLAPSAVERFSRAGSVARSIIEARVEASGLSDECPIAFFDTRLRVNGVPQAQSSQSQVSEDFRSTNSGQGWSRNTVMAVEYLKGELQTEAGGLDEDKSLSFDAAARAVSCSERAGLAAQD